MALGSEGITIIIIKKTEDFQGKFVVFPVRGKSSNNNNFFSGMARTKSLHNRRHG